MDIRRVFRDSFNGTAPGWPPSQHSLWLGRLSDDELGAAFAQRVPFCFLPGVPLCYGRICGFFPPGGEALFGCPVVVFGLGARGLTECCGGWRTRRLYASFLLAASNRENRTSGMGRLSPLRDQPFWLAPGADLEREGKEKGKARKPQNVTGWTSFAENIISKLFARLVGWNDCFPAAGRDHRGSAS